MRSKDYYVLTEYYKLVDEMFNKYKEAVEKRNKRTDKKEDKKDER